MYGQNYKVVELQGVVPTGVEQQVTGGRYSTGLTGVTGGIQTGLVGGRQNITGGIEGLWEQPEIVAELCQLPRVLPVYAKTRQGLEEIMQHAEQNPSDLSIQCLLNAHSTYTPKVYPFRGFTLVNGEQKLREIEQVEQLEQRPVWFMFSGMGIEQWQCGSLGEMMKLDSFRRSILRSSEALRPYGINLLHLINTQVEQAIMTGVESFVYLTAVQIALVDCLRQIGVRAEGLIGQSIGELVCAYVDQCLTHEQALMTSYHLAKCVQQAKSLPKSTMAVIGGLTWEQLRSRCPSGVVPVSLDSVDQFMITGPVQQVRELLRQLRLEGIVVREMELPTQGENFGLMHSQYLSEMMPVLRQYLECLNIVPKQRSSRWVSTSVPEHKWTSPMGQHMNVEYLLNLITSPVMLQQTLRQVPTNALVIEISPRSLISTLLRKSFVQQHQFVPTIISLTPSYHASIESKPFFEHFLVQLGRLYIEGVDFDSVKLFVPAETTLYPIPVQKSQIDFFSRLNINFEPSIYIIQPDQIKDQVFPEQTRDIKTSLQFVPYTEIFCEKPKGGYIMVDKDHNENEFVFNSILPTTDNKSLINEFYDYYLNECKRYLQFTIYRIENPAIQIDIQPTPLPSVLKEQIEHLTIYYQTIRKQTPVQMRLVELFDGGRLLTFLKEISQVTSTGLLEKIKSLNEVLHEDLVLGQISKTQFFLKNILDLVVENFERDSKFRILEISGSVAQFNGDRVSEILATHPELSGDIEYNYVPMNYSYEMAKTYFNKFNVLDWNLRFTNGKFEHQIPAESNGQYDLVILNGCLSTSIALTSEHESKNWIHNSVEKCLKPSGFVLFSEFTSNFEFVELLHKLERLVYFQNVKLVQQIGQLETLRKQSPLETQSKIEQQIKQLEKLLGQETKLTLQDMTQWTRFLDGLTLVPICVKSDSKLKTLFVYRKPVGHLYETRIVIDEFLTHEKESLIEKIRSTINDQKIERLWLINEKQLTPQCLQTALVSILYGLRHEKNGHKIKCLFQLDNEKVVLESKEMEKWSQILDKIRKADLFMNVFQSGLWGTFRLTETLCEIKVKDFEGKKSDELFQADETYIIINGLDTEFGFELSQWMVESGVKYLILTTNKSNVSEFMSLETFKKLNDLQNIYGVEIRISSVLDLNEENECLGLIKQGCRMSPEGKIGGVFHLGIGEESAQSLFNLDKMTRCGSIMAENGYFVAFKNGNDNFVTKVCELRNEDMGRHALAIDFDVLTGEKKCFGLLENLLKNKIKKSEKKGFEEVAPKHFLIPKKLVQKLNDVAHGLMTRPVFVTVPIGENETGLKRWAEQFSVPVYGLYFTPECMRHETVEQLGQFYWQQIEKVFPQLEKFHLVGYTYGVPVAFEMASRRPQQVMSLVLLDSGLTQSFLNTGSFGYERQSITGGVSELEGLYKFYQQFVLPSTRIAYEQFVQVLSQLGTFDERVKYVVGKIVEQSQQVVDSFELEQAARLFVRQMIMSGKYVPTQPLRLTKILVVRPTNTTTVAPKYESYVYGQQQQQSELFEQELVEKIFQGLRQFVSGKVQVHLVDSDQKSFFECARIASILNQHLNREF